MFDPQDHPRLFGVPPGVDFPNVLVDGLIDRLKGHDPSSMARVALFLNTERMRRRVTALFHERGAGFLPQIRLVTDLARDPGFGDVPLPANPLERRLHLTQLVRQLIASDPSIASEDSAYDLADSLANLMDEMQGEAVSPDTIARLDVGNHSDHWQRSQKFITLIQNLFDQRTQPDIEARQRMIVERLIVQWQHNPPDHPVIVAGSTGARGTTNLLMRAVAKLPQGAVILPGFDTHMKPQDWADLAAPAEAGLSHEDHPQYRFFTLCTALEVAPVSVPAWSRDQPPSPDRNRLVSLALRPAPVTDRWMTEGPELTGLVEATSKITLLEAPSPRVEAVAIALRLREAVEHSQTAALITPDRQLARQVTAALQKWGIVPDDSAGVKLPQTPVGRLLRQIAELMHERLTAEKLLGLLKHPIVESADKSKRGPLIGHLELKALRRDTPFPTKENLSSWAKERGKDSEPWLAWLFECLAPLQNIGETDLTTFLETLITAAERLAAGPDTQGSGELWDREAGSEARKIVDALTRAAPAGGEMSPRAFADLLHAVMTRYEVREVFAVHRGVMIWGTLEARVQGADLVILAGLNDGVWPEATKPDPWLNRAMRLEAGLLPPERRIGLSAHDFQQAVAASEVWLTRSTRDAEAQTVPSRWLNRLSNLMKGLEAEGKPAHEAMTKRGEAWADLAIRFETFDKTPSAKRPAPRPPLDQRPDQLSVTRIQTLIRDPYAIYARYILNLKPLDPLVAQADAPMRGQALHNVLQAFTDATQSDIPADAAQMLMQLADEEFAANVPWPATRQMWRAKFERAVPWFLNSEHARRQVARPLKSEAEGEVVLPALGFTLDGRADRIDQTPTGSFVIYDYKTGSLPTKKVQKYFDKQLSLLACIGERGQFKGLARSTVDQISYIGLGASPEERETKLEPGALDAVWSEFTKLIASYATPEQGYQSRRAVEELGFDGDYDHLARYGEWDQIDDAVSEEVGHDPQ